jgi:hypothetical protein
VLVEWLKVKALSSNASTKKKKKKKITVIHTFEPFILLAAATKDSTKRYIKYTFTPSQPLSLILVRNLFPGNLGMIYLAIDKSSAQEQTDWIHGLCFSIFIRVYEIF